MKKDLKSKLLRYSAVASAAATVGVANGQVLYTDITDTTITGNNNYYDLDLNLDAIPDFRILQLVDSGLVGNVNAVLISPFDSIYNLASGEKINGFNYPFNITPGTILDQHSDFKGIGGPEVKGYMAFEVDGVSYPNSNWVGPLTNGFLGLQVRIGDSVHFAWARIDIGQDSKSFIVKDFAVQLIAGDSIIVGEELLSVTQNLLENSKIYVSHRNLRVELLGDIKEARLTLLDLQGRALREEDISGITEIDLSDLPSGFYLVHLNHKGIIRTEKIVIQ